MLGRCHRLYLFVVAPLAGAWIEMYMYSRYTVHQEVAPLAGAWIEIRLGGSPREICLVAPLAGAWIEITSANTLASLPTVAPLAGAWIEIDRILPGLSLLVSLPSRERGLKLPVYCPFGVLSGRSPRGSVD